MKLVAIPENKYEAYRLDAIFKAYKWDPQFVDNNTVARHALVLSRAEADELNALTVALTAETLAAEHALNQNLAATKPLALPRPLKRLLPAMHDYDEQRHVRLMRFDFHPVAGGGYAISEVNSDVPGGFAEASLLPKLAAAYLGGGYQTVDFGERLADAVANKTKPGGRVAMVHCTSYSDDRQVMQFLGDLLAMRGLEVIYMASDHLTFDDRKAVSVLSAKEGAVDFIFRFTPVEWLLGTKPNTWHGYFDTVTPSCNHPVAVYAQTKRLPLCFAALETMGVTLSAWKALLPETLDVRAAKGRDGFIFKPACGRVGEGISIRAACTEDEYKSILKSVRRHPKAYIAQHMFDSRPLSAGEEQFHVCIGSYSIEGEAAGFYARMSRTRRIDSFAADIPVLIEGETV